MADELVIRISGDIGKFDDALAEVSKKTESLNDKLESFAKKSAIAFAALTAEVVFSAKAFGEAQAIGLRLNTAMENQGVFTEELRDRYEKLANALQDKTGIDDDEIKNVIAITQGYIGQKEVTEGVTRAILDLAAGKKIDLETSAELISKGINGQTQALQRLGIVVEEGLSRGERQARILELVSAKFGGQAEAANKGLGSLRALETAFGNLQEEIGSRFAPALEAGIKQLTAFINTVKDNKPLVDLVVSLTTAGALVTGLGAAGATAAIGLLRLQAALKAAEIATSATSIAVKGLVASTGLGLLLVIATEIYLNWSTIWPKTQGVFRAAAADIGATAAALGKLITGAFVIHDLSLIKQGYEEIKAIVQRGLDDTVEIAKAKTLAESREAEEVAARKKAIADKEQAERNAHEARAAATRKAQNQLITLEAQQASKEVIDLKKQEVDILTKIEDDKFAKVRGILQVRLAEIRQLEAQAAEDERNDRKIFQDEILTQVDEFQQLSTVQRQQFLLQNQQALVSQVQSEEQVRQASARKNVQIQIQMHNQLLADQQKYGKAYAALNFAMNTEQWAGAQKLSDSLIGLQQSGNATLRALGKGAALISIGTSTAKGATAAYAGAIEWFGPIFGPPIGAALAGAVIAFGAEQTGKVLGLEKGGLITGGVPGIDSVPVLAQHGELMAPAQNFDEVIGSVRAAREAEKLGGGIGGGETVIILQFNDDFAKVVEASIARQQKNGTSILKRIT